MSLKRGLLELLVAATARVSRVEQRRTTAKPKSVFVLRNNDIGDLLVVTPLFEALKRAYPESRLGVGVGSWNVDVLKHNPFIDECLLVNAPWHNKHVSRYSPNSVRGLLDSIRYILRSPEARTLADRRFDVGIDVLGSPQGSLLMIRAGIPYRIGVKGYAGGHSGTQQSVSYEPKAHVGVSALRVAKVLGAENLPDSRPQLFLSEPEIAAAEEHWRGLKRGGDRAARIVIGPGGGFLEKCWPLAQYIELAKRLGQEDGCCLAIVGGAGDRPAGARLTEVAIGARDFTGRFALRETFALVASADLVICNSSMLMHVAAAFSKPAIVLLGSWYSSAREHAEQWGHGEHSTVLGPEPHDPQICTTDAAFGTAMSIIQKTRRE